MKNNKGFTLIEMIVVLAVIAVLSITVSFSANQVQRSTVVKSNKDTLNKIADAAKIYSNLSKGPTGCIKPTNCSSSCTITLDCLIKKGLLDENLLKKINPLSNKNFTGNDNIIVDKSNGETKISFTCKGKQIDSNDINTNDKYKKLENWGEC